MDVPYGDHDGEYKKHIDNEELNQTALTWMDDSTLDRWRHNLMLSPIKPFITSNSSWLTLGDGRFGTEAHYILQNGGDAHATDISTELLKIGSSKGFIKDFSKQNAENITFEDESFDYVLIKEAFHHFPRPWIALYEAFRICKKAVLIIEPSDELSIFSLPFRVSKNIIKKILGKTLSTKYSFEEIGNFVYKINEKELEKFLLGMHYTSIAFIGLNDYYEPGMEFCPLEGGTKKNQRFVQKAKKSLFLLNLISELKISDFSLLGAALFKENPSKMVIADLQELKWRFKELPLNPYLKNKY